MEDGQVHDDDDCRHDQPHPDHDDGLDCGRQGREPGVHLGVVEVGDVAQHITKVIATSFKIGIQLSAPFLVFGLLFNVGLGVLSRLMPQMQVFFIGLPLSIILGFALLIAVMGAMMGTFTGYLEGVLRDIAPHS